MENRNNPFDAKLKQTLSGAKSPLPEGMLDKILENQNKKRRLIIWWVVTGISVFLLLVLGTYFLRNSAESSRDIVTTPDIEKKETPFNHTPAKQTDTAPSNSAKVSVPDRSTLVYPNPDQSNSAVSNTKTPVTTPANNHTSPKSDTSRIVKNTPSNPAPAPAPKPANPEPGETPKPAETPVPKTEPVVVKNENPKDSAGGNESIIPLGKKPAKPNNSSHKFSLKKIRPECYVSLGWMQEQQKISLTQQSVDFVHKDYLKQVQTAVKPLTGAAFSFGVQGLIRQHLRIQTGLQFMQATNTLAYSYTIAETAVTDADGRITGYKPLDSFGQHAVSSSSAYVSRSFAIPVQMGYAQPLPGKFEITAFLGMVPQWKLAGYWKLPGKTDLTQFSEVKMPSVFSMPVTAGLGLFRKEDTYTIGIQGRFSPQFSGPYNVNDYTRISWQQSSIAFLAGFRIGK